MSSAWSTGWRSPPIGATVTRHNHRDFTSHLGGKPAFLDILVEAQSAKLEKVVAVALEYEFGKQAHSEFALYQFGDFWYGIGEYGPHRVGLLHFADIDLGLLITVANGLPDGVRIHRVTGLDHPPAPRSRGSSMRSAR